MKKKLDESTIVNELRDSLHFQRPQEEPTAGDEPTTGDPQPSLTAEPAAGMVTGDRAYGRTTVRSIQRSVKRHPFEFYQDQLDALKQLSLQEQLAGGRGNMSEMVRDAIDEYLAKRRDEERT